MFKRYFLALFLGSLFPVPVFAQTPSDAGTQGGSRVDVELTGRSGDADSDGRLEIKGKLSLANPDQGFPIPREGKDHFLGGGEVCFVSDGGIVFGLDGERNIDYGQVGIKLGIQDDRLRNSNYTRFEIYPYKAHLEGEAGAGDTRYLNGTGARLNLVHEAGKGPLAVYLDGSVDYLFRTHSVSYPTLFKEVEVRTDGINANLNCGIILGLGRDDMGDRQVSFKAGLQYQVSNIREKAIASGLFSYDKDILAEHKRSRLMPTVGISINTAKGTRERERRRSFGANY